MTGAKAWRQKGTGRARVGALSSPHRKGGGVAFGPKPRAYTVKVNRKARRRALRAALSVHAERGSLAGIDPATFDTPSTKAAAAALGRASTAAAACWWCSTDGEETVRQVVPQPRRRERQARRRRRRGRRDRRTRGSWSPRPRSSASTEKARAPESES